MYGRGKHERSRPAPQSTQGEPQRYVVDHQFWGSAHLTTTLAHALSDVTRTDVRRIEGELADLVDTMALDRIFRPRPDGTLRGGSSLSFTVFGYHVTVYGTGRIEILQPYQPYQA